jgi:predicted GTPase
VQQMMHQKLKELRTGYGDSDENDQKFLDAYLEVMEKRKANTG